LKRPRFGYQYLAPWFNFYEQDTYKPDPRESIIVVPATYYGEPNSSRVVLLCEGKSDKAALDFLLDKVFPLWSRMNIVVVQTRGRAGIPFLAEVATQLDVRFVSVPDLDARPFFENVKLQPEWASALALMKAAPIYYLEPDLEGCDTDALLATVTELNPHSVYDKSRVTKELEAYVSQVRSGARKSVEGGTLTFVTSAIRAYWKNGPSLRGMNKSEELGRLLAKKWLDTTIPKRVADALYHAIALARGLQFASQVELGTHVRLKPKPA